MSFADDILNKLFPSSKQAVQSSDRPVEIDSGLLARSKAENDAYAKWVLDHGDDVLHELKQNAFTSQKNMGDRLSFLWFNRPNANGFRFHLGGLYTEVPESWYILELLKHRVMNMGYFVQSDRYVIHEVQSEIQRTEWYYLKVPHSQRMFGPPYEQLYGNVQLELNNGEHTTLKMLVTSYPDRSYKDAHPFDEMVDRMFDRLSS